MGSSAGKWSQTRQGTAAAVAAALTGAAGIAYVGGDDNKAFASWFSSSAEQQDAPVPKSVSENVSVYDIPIGKKMPEECICFIEVAKGSRNKYEWDNDIGFLRLDRVLHSAVFYPHNYGFIPQTLCGDGDPLDVLVMGDYALQPGCFVDIRPIAYMVMEDEKGMDEKVLAVSSKDPHFAQVTSLRDVPEHVLRETAHFFSTYKALEKKKWAKVGGWKGTEDTKELIEQTHKSYMKATRFDRLSRKPTVTVQYAKN